MKKLVLIDQSLQAPGGHYYEYDKRILDFAASEDYETILLASSKFSGKNSHKTIPAFSKNFWQNFHFYNQRYFGLRLPSSVQPRVWLKIRRIAVSTYRKVVFSKIGLAIERLKGRSLISLAIKPKSFVETKSLVDTDRLELIVAWFLRRAWDVYEFVFLKPGGRKFKWAVLALLTILFLPMLTAIGFYYFFVRAYVILTAKKELPPGDAFVKEVKAALDGVDVDRDTIFFVPNATTAEIEALIKLSAEKSPIAEGRWALLFRRPLFSGYPSTFKSQLNDLSGFRNDIARLKVFGDEINVTFYTDTYELTDQYNLLDIFEFQTLPVPVDIPDNVRERESSVGLTVAYLGDAREEKGYHNLQSVVEYLNRDKSMDGKVKFLFQSNFSFPGGDQLSRHACHDLENAAISNLELIYGPFESKEYGKHLNDADIVVVPYSAQEYFARSSGIFMEAISRGIPVVVPAGSWMSNIIERDRALLLEKQLGELTPLREIKQTIGSHADGAIDCDVEANYFALRLKLDRDVENPVRIHIYVCNQLKIEIHRAQMVYRPIENKILAVFKIPQASEVKWVIELIGDDLDPTFECHEATLYNTETEIRLEEGVATFDGPEHLPKVVRDVVLNYPDHKIAAEKLRSSLRDRYDPANLIRILEATTGPRSSPSLVVS